MATTVRCPRCRERTPWEGNPHRPFCSERCRQADLGAWASEEFKVPGEPVSLDPDDEDSGGSNGPLLH